MFFAQDVAETTETTRFFMFDLFMLAFTIIIAIGLYRLLRAPEKNYFAIGFTGLCLIVFLGVDVIMAMNWFGRL